MSLERLEGLEAAHLMPNYRRLPVEFVRGEGCLLWDDEGNEYLDLLGGIAVDNVGHCHPAVVSAVREQVGRLIHVSNLFYTEPGVELAARLSKRSLGGKVFLCNSGAEANEAAIKLARRHRRGGGIVVLDGAFHGRTMGALSATPQEDKQAPFAPLVPGFVSVPPEPEAIRSAVGPETAAVLIEPIQGESGVHPIPPAALAAARGACDAAGALLIFDEVQTGAGRTGTLWAYEQGGVTPDAITLAKGLGGGMPIGALVTSAGLDTVLGPGDHGSTFAGGPVVCAAALAALDVIEAPGFLDGIIAKGARLRGLLEDLDGVSAVRGSGLMIGFDVDVDAPALVRAALEGERIVINATGPSTIRLVPPLVISDAEIERGAGAIGRLLAAARSSSA